jgi:hypothetical protein
MTDPIKSAYQDPAWEPTVYLTGNKQANQDQRDAASKYTSVYGGSYTTTSQSAPKDTPGPGAKVPDVAAAYTQAPDLVPNPPAPAGSGSPGPSSGSSNPFYIDLGALRTAEQKCLNATSDAMNGYDTLKSTATAAISSPYIFGQDVEATSYQHAGRDTGPLVTAYDQLDPEGQQFAASTDPAMQQLLAEVGGVLVMMGQFNALLNNGGQMYTYTDDSSAFPPT